MTIYWSIRSVSYLLSSRKKVRCDQCRSYRATHFMTSKFIRLCHHLQTVSLTDCLTLSTKINHHLSNLNFRRKGIGVMMKGLASQTQTTVSRKAHSIRGKASKPYALSSHRCMRISAVFSSANMMSSLARKTFTLAFKSGSQKASFCTASQWIA